MANRIVQQPNGLYAIWSTVVDDFTMIDCTPEEIIDEWTEAERVRIVESVRKVIQQLKEGGKPYFQFTETFDECVARIRELHGADAESLKMLEVGAP